MLRTLLIAPLLVAATASAQDTPPVPHAPPAPVIAPLAAIPGLPGEDVLAFVSSELGGRTVVKGAPYSATAVSETRQVLVDGNRIVRSTSSRIYRDGQGRTRQEQGMGVVFINDVVAGKRLLLHTDRRTARELPLRPARSVPVPPVPPVPGAAPTPPVPPAHMSSDEAQSWAESMRQWAREFATRMRGEAAQVEREVNVVVRRSEEGAGQAPQGLHERIEIVRLGDAQAPRPALIGAPLLPPQGPGTRIALGSKDFDGVRADGTRTTWTIPAGQIGNEKPIEIVSERWYSPELMVVVHSRHADPRSGERIYRLEDIRRDEPPAELFRVPGDYETRAPAARAGK